MLIAHTNPSIVHINAIPSIDLEHRQIALLAGRQLQQVSVFVTKIVGVGIGIGGKGKGIKNENRDMQTKRKASSNTSAGNVNIAALKTGAYLKLTILTRLKSCVLNIDNILRQYDFRYGKKRKIIYKFFVQIVTALKLTLNHGLNDIACKRIEEAYRQPDMFTPAPKKAEQISIDLPEPLL